MKKPEFRVPTIAGLVVVVAGLIAGLFAVGSPLGLRTGAVPEEVPRGVRITNVTDVSFVMSWTTEKAVAGYVGVKEDRFGAFERILSDDRDQELGLITNYFTHLVTVKNLRANTTYIMRAGSGRSLFEPQRVTTGPVLTSLPTADIAFGQVVTSSGDPATGSIVYAELPDTVVQAAMVRPSGSWVIPLSISRRKDLKSYANYDRKSAQIHFVVEGGPVGRASLQTTTEKDSPVAVLTLVANTPTVVPSPGDGLVINRPQEKEVSSETIVSGKTTPGAAVKYSVDGKEGTVTASEDGVFKIDVGPLTSGDHVVTAVTTSQGRAYLVVRNFRRP